jgi:hypothetical protein
MQAYPTTLPITETVLAKSNSGDLQLVYVGNYYQRSWEVQKLIKCSGWSYSAWTTIKVCNSLDEATKVYNEEVTHVTAHLSA